MSDEITQSGALYNGTDKGRIYRIVPEKGLSMNWLGKLNLSKKMSVEIVKLLESENGWYRRTAQRLLLHRQSKEAVPALRELISKSKLPEAKVHALWLLDAMESLENEELVQAFKSSEAGVRENAIRVAEGYLNGDFKGDLEKELVALQNDESAKVRFQLLNTLGFLKSPEAEKARLAILKRDFNNRWAGLAGIASFAGKENQIFDLAIKEFTQKQTPESAEFFSNLAATIANGTDKSAVSEMLKKTAVNTRGVDWWKAATLNGITKLWQFKKSPGLLSVVEKEQLLTHFSPETSPELRAAALSLLEVAGLPKGKVLDEKTEMASKILGMPSSDKGPETVAFRVDAIILLTLANPDGMRPALQQILTQKYFASVQAAALKALGKVADDQTCLFLLKEMKNFSPSLKTEAVNVFLSKPERINLLLKSIEEKEVDKSIVGWRQMVRLMNYYDADIRAYARKVLSVNEDRKAVLNKYMPALEMKGVQSKGKLVFEKNCSSCHQIEGVKGVNFGPDLSTLRSRNATSVLTEILNPNNSIADNYDFWTLELKNGTSISGVISQENATGLSVREMGGTESVIQRKDVAKMQKSEISIMPNGLENAISLQDMADLIAFIKKQ
jgi:putative heme-binding domain-containing protein